MLMPTLIRAKSAGAKIVEELNETAYGERQCGAEYLEGLFLRTLVNLTSQNLGYARGNLLLMRPTPGKRCGLDTTAFPDDTRRRSGTAALSA
jgi:hypothetical protein